MKLGDERSLHYHARRDFENFPTPVPRAAGLVSSRHHAGQGSLKTLSASGAGQVDRSVSFEFQGSLKTLSARGAGRVDSSVSFEYQGSFNNLSACEAGHVGRSVRSARFTNTHVGTLKIFPTPVPRAAGLGKCLSSRHHARQGRLKTLSASGAVQVDRSASFEFQGRSKWSWSSRPLGELSKSGGFQYLIGK